MVLEPRNLNGIDEDIEKIKMDEQINKANYYRDSFSKNLINTLIALGILAIIAIVFMIIITRLR